MVGSPIHVKIPQVQGGHVVRIREKKSRVHKRSAGRQVRNTLSAGTETATTASQHRQELENAGARKQGDRRDHGLPPFDHI